MRCEHPLDRFHRLFGAAFLNIADNRVDDNNRQNHTGIHPVLQRSCDAGRRNQYVDQHIVEMRHEPQQRAALGWIGQAVGPVRDKAAGGLVSAKPVWSCGHCIQCIGRRHRMTGWRLLLVGHPGSSTFPSCIVTQESLCLLSLRLDRRNSGPLFFRRSAEQFNLAVCGILERFHHHIRSNGVGWAKNCS